jgi:hypothetical protein
MTLRGSRDHWLECNPILRGAYPSRFHVAWWLPDHENRSRPDARALIVDNEPEVFWDGSGAEEQLTRWRTAVGFDDRSWGRVDLPPAGNNGPSGQWLAEQILRPLGYVRAECWITDCLDTARVNPQQAKRIEDTYLPQVDRLRLPLPDMPASASQVGVRAHARSGHPRPGLILEAPFHVVKLGSHRGPPDRGGPPQFPPSPSERSTPHTPGSSWRLRFQALHRVHGLHRDFSGSALPCRTLAGTTPNDAAGFA